MRPLLAKSPRAGRADLSLARHLQDAEEAAVAVFGPDQRWGRSFARLFRLDASQVPAFLLNLRVAALFHDIGKANEQFQAMLTGRGAQTFRHEHISALVLHLPGVRAWITACPDADHDAITAAVLSHHLKASESGEGTQWGQPRDLASQLELHLAHPEVQRALDRVGALVGGPVPELPSGTVRLPAGALSEPWASALREGRAAAARFRRSRKREPSRHRLALAVKAGLIVADSVASGLFREGHVLDTWLAGTARLPPLSADDVGAAIIEPRLRAIEERLGRPVALHDFQREVATQPDRCLLLAACGAGKTMAAWAWARARCERHELGRVLFLYPTRGTATEGFRDYVGWAPERESALLHGSSAYVLEAMHQNPPDALDGKRPGPSEEEQRLFALGHWSRRYFSATADQFLSFLEHRYEALCLLPMLADAAVIIDEVHSYDERMFATLLTFLETFDGPVLCMTATLSPARRAQLEERGGLAAFPRAEDRSRIEALERAERAPRYRLERVESADAALGAAREAIEKGLRVLWVVNTVARCQETADGLEATLGRPVLCYHSRFRLMDRERMHAATVAAFQSGDRAPVAAVTTQVCEMSLDLDADLLITELAPPSSLVQRFGRANRHLARGPDFRARLLVYAPEASLPYDRQQLDSARAFVDELQGRALCQAELAEALVRHSPPEAAADDATAFTTSGYYAVPGSFRDIEDFTVSAVLDRDLVEALDRLRSRRPLDGLVLPVPRGTAVFDSPPPPWPRHLSVVSAAAYHRDRGFLRPREDN